MVTEVRKGPGEIYKRYGDRMYRHTRGQLIPLMELDEGGLKKGINHRSGVSASSGDHVRSSVNDNRYITWEKNRKYIHKKSQVCQIILAISKFLRHHTCDFYLRFFQVYLRFHAYLRYFVRNHTCDLNRKYGSRNRKYGGPKGPLVHNIASMPRIKSQVCQD